MTKIFGTGLESFGYYQVRLGLDLDLNQSCQRHQRTALDDSFYRGTLISRTGDGHHCSRPIERVAVTVCSGRFMAMKAMLDCRYLETPRVRLSTNAATTGVVATVALSWELFRSLVWLHDGATESLAVI